MLLKVLKLLFPISLLVFLYILCYVHYEIGEATKDCVIGLNNWDFIVGEEFNIGKDVFALVDIQETGTSEWEIYMHEHLQLQLQSNYWMPICALNVGNSGYICYRGQQKSIIWERHSSVFCGQHADYTELKNCVMHEYKNRISIAQVLLNYDGIIYFMTFLRDPISRYVSEYESVRKRGDSWTDSVRTCKNVKKCYNGSSWKDVNWEEFLNCEYNPANNRQVRMLANYNILGCNALKCWTNSSICTSNQIEFYEEKLLQSAKHTLSALPFFGLAEYPEETEYLFIKTFSENKFRFNQHFKPPKTNSVYPPLEFFDQIKLKNRLDIQLYEFAKTLFFKKYFQFKINEKFNK